jgi:hypothetical protein
VILAVGGIVGVGTGRFVVAFTIGAGANPDFCVIRRYDNEVRIIATTTTIARIAPRGLFSAVRVLFTTFTLFNYLQNNFGERQFDEER